MFNVQHSISIEIDEKGLKQLIIDEIARQNPTIVVDDIKFTQRRKPTEIEVEVAGHVEDADGNKVVTASTATATVVEEVEEAIEEEAEEEAVEQEEEVLDAASQLLAEESLDDMLADEEPEEEEEDPFAD